MASSVLGLLRVYSKRLVQLNENWVRPLAGLMNYSQPIRVLT